MVSGSRGGVSVSPGPALMWREISSVFTKARPASSRGELGKEGQNGRSGKKRVSGAGAGWNGSMRREGIYCWTSCTHVIGDIHWASGKNAACCS